MTDSKRQLRQHKILDTIGESTTYAVSSGIVLDSSDRSTPSIKRVK